MKHILAALALIATLAAAHADGINAPFPEGLSTGVTRQGPTKKPGGSVGTGYSASGPPAGLLSVTSTAFTVTLSTGTFSGTQTITIADGSQGGTLTPSVGAPGTSTVIVTPTAGTSSFTFTYKPVVLGAITLTFTNAQGWINPNPLTYISTLAYTASGPSTGLVNVASTNFTVSLSGGTFNGSNSISVADGAQAGTFTPSVGAPSTSIVTVTPTTGTSSFTFTYTPIVVATITLTFTNNSSFIDPSPLTYTSTGGGPPACTQGSLKFNNVCNTVWMHNFVLAP
jgi:hypothetical protein